MKKLIKVDNEYLLLAIGMSMLIQDTISRIVIGSIYILIAVFVTAFKGRDN